MPLHGQGDARTDRMEHNHDLDAVLVEHVARINVIGDAIRTVARIARGGNGAANGSAVLDCAAVASITRTVTMMMMILMLNSNSINMKCD